MTADNAIDRIHWLFADQILRATAVWAHMKITTPSVEGQNFIKQ